MAIAKSIKSKNKIYETFCKEKNPQKKEIYGKQFITYRNYLTRLLRITNDDYYKTHFKKIKKIENCMENHCRNYKYKNHTHMKRWGTPQNLFLAYIDELEK